MAKDIHQYTAKGGMILGIVATAHAKGIAHWNALGPALLNPVSQMVQQLNSSQEVVAITNAVMRTMGGHCETAVPNWVVRVVENSSLLARIGNEVPHFWPPDSSKNSTGGIEGGKSALAIAICRNTDLSTAVTKLFDPTQQSHFWDLVSLAAVLAPPGVPSALRKKIKMLANSKL